MSADWEFYICPVDDRPALVFVDLGLCDEVPDPERPWLLRVTVKMLIVRDDGLGDQEETEALYAIEDGLFEALARGLGARYVGRITSQGNRDLFYYSNSDEGFTDAADTIMAGFSKYEYQC